MGWGGPKFSGQKTRVLGVALTPLSPSPQRGPPEGRGRHRPPGPHRDQGRSLRGEDRGGGAGPPPATPSLPKSYLFHPNKTTPMVTKRRPLPQFGRFQPRPPPLIPLPAGGLRLLSGLAGGKKKNPKRNGLAPKRAGSTTSVSALREATTTHRNRAFCNQKPGQHNPATGPETPRTRNGVYSPQK